MGVLATRSRRIVSCLAVAAIALAGCGNKGGDQKPTNGTATGEPIIIGMDEDSTGSGAAYSVIAGKTIRLAIQDINDKGGVLGRPIKLVVENDESDPTKVPATLQKLASQGAKALFLQSGSAAILQAKSTLTQLGLPAIAPTGVTATLVTPPDNELIYMLANTTNDWAQVYCGAFAAAGIKKIGVLTDDTTTIAALDKALFAQMSCVQFVATEKGAANASDLSAQVARLKNANPDAILVTSVGGAFEVLAQNTLGSQMAGTKRFSLASIGNQPSSWKLAAPGALNGLIFMGSINTENPRTKDLIKLLQDKNGKDYDITAYDAQAWDAVHVLKAAIEKAGGVDDPKKLNEAMQTIKGYPATFGQGNFTLSFSAEKHLGADGACGLSLVEFGSDNKPKGPWATFQPPCNK
ncbi:MULTISPECIES: ABC transporter substrate-binding protein [Dactylosporangium]|uniref:Amino acid-binding protein n=2 Tax=Dactylosporangium TaxID=35753 RepID=A0A9W6KPA8_9ACTN|nr:MULTISPECIES: ABC transporter substrate-binding protein [Dactylosporangium]UAC00366.1 ABC transporter substrate-binding protein [Dactylosporangium vinaceum]UWZ47928.1 ABC transporter substrate-binding protein [Dactylosporangium matsuzakiense]GLL04264.1 amino acid-binding protein [Dactylosporangium matsuzakiense]